MWCALVLLWRVLLLLWWCVLLLLWRVLLLLWVRVRLERTHLNALRRIGEQLRMRLVPRLRRANARDERVHLR